MRTRTLPLGFLSAAVLLLLATVDSRVEAADSDAPKSSSTWPSNYSVQRDDTAGVLRLSTPFYTFEHDLRKGGAIRRISLTHGRADNLLVAPIESRIRRADGALLRDVSDAAPKVMQAGDAGRPVITVECSLADAEGRPAGIRVRTRFEYRWGYVKIRREFVPSDGVVEVAELTPIAAVIAPSLSHYGYREGRAEEDGAPPFSFGSNLWGKLRQGEEADRPVETTLVPRSAMFVDPGVEGLEWFVGSDLTPWEKFAGQRGQGRFSLTRSEAPSGLAMTVSPLGRKEGAEILTETKSFTFYLAVPLLEGHALEPWLHTSFNRNRGSWVSPETIREWAEKGIQTVHCHNDGDYYDDGLFWRDGSYPPYPDMEGYDKVLRECRSVGIRTATYFSNKELHPSTEEFKTHGQEWGRKNNKGTLQHNIFRGQSEFGAQMCLRSGWLDFLKLSIDRVLKNHPLDGVYYDWNVALYCRNPLHEGLSDQATAQGHWDVDELLDLMEWTRDRVGPRGLVIVHNTTTPMFVMENFADYIVATEWGYQKWTDRAPDLDNLPLEWNLACARARGVISYGTLAANAPRRLHRLFAVEAFLGGVTPWPASRETFELAQLLKPLGNFESYKFADWRNQAVTLSDARCASAVYSSPDRAYVLLANLDQEAREVKCTLHPEKLPCALTQPTSVRRLNSDGTTASDTLDLKQLLEGTTLHLAGDQLMLIEVK